MSNVNAGRYSHVLGASGAAPAQGAQPNGQQPPAATEPTILDRAAAAHKWKPGMLRALLGSAEIVERDATVFTEHGVVTGKSYFLVENGADGAKVEKLLSSVFSEEQLAILTNDEAPNNNAGNGDYFGLGDYQGRNRYGHNLPTK